TMQDDGTGTGVFGLQLSLNEPTAGEVRLAVSAAFQRLLKRVISLPTVITVTAPSGGFITDFTPEGLQSFLTSNPDVDTAAKFLERLQADDFKKYWIMMTRTESTQRGDAEKPRFILPHKDASKVFGIELEGADKEQ